MTNPNDSINSNESKQRNNRVDDTVITTKLTGGLTKREYFAAKAMQGILSNPRFFEEVLDEHQIEHAIKMADALIEALNAK